MQYMAEKGPFRIKGMVFLVKTIYNKLDNQRYASHP